MRVAIYFKKHTEGDIEIPVSNQKELNSYIHRCIGHDNEYHDSFSTYSISSVQGGRLDKNTGMLRFVSGMPHIYVSSDDSEFMQKLIDGVISGGKTFFDMEFDYLRVADFVLGKYCDSVVTISPILLKKNGTKITFRDNGWLESLTEQCVSKLKHAGISPKGFSIELRQPERAKRKMVYVGDIFNPCSQVSLKVHGSIAARKYIYTVGFGNSCGSGFGSVKIYG